METIEALGISQTELAERTGRPKKTINEIIHGRAAITADTAIQFERVLEIPTSFWLSLEANYREALACESARRQLEQIIEWMKAFNVKAMISKGFLREASDPVSQFEELLSFFGVASPEAFNCTIEALSAWLRQGEIKIRTIKCKPFNRSKFARNLVNIRKFTTKPLGLCLPEIQYLLAESRVAFVLVPELPSCPVSGLTQWLSAEKALLLMSLRYKKDGVPTLG